MSNAAVSAQDIFTSNPFQHNPRPFRSDRLLIQPKSAGAQAKLSKWHAKQGAKVLRQFPDLGEAQVIELPPGAEVQAMLARYRESGLVAHAEPDFFVQAHAEPNDPFYADGSLWGLNNIGQNGGLPGADIDAPEGWDTLNDARSIVVAVIDSGIRYTHQDLAANMWRNPGEVPGNGADDDRNGFRDDVHGINALTETGDPNDDNGHGTHVAGIIGAIGNNGLGVTGVAWRVQLMALKFMDATGNGSVSDAIQCLDYARAKGAHVINASWGSTNASSLLDKALERARQAGIIVVCSAGNDSRNNDLVPSYPASTPLDNILSVTATTRIDSFYPFGNFGASSVDLAAPGSPIVSTWFTSDTAYASSSGSSAAAPHVSGTLALLRARFPGSTYRQLIDRILTNTVPLPELAGKCSTGGRLNLAKALGPAPRGVLEVSLEAGAILATLVGGPLLTSTRTFTLRNTGTASLTWQASSSQPWLNLAPANGTLAIGTTTTVTATLGPGATALPAGTHASQVSFTNSSASPAPVQFELPLSVEKVPSLTASALGGGSTVTLRIDGQPGGVYVIEASTDLAAWMPVSTNIVAADGVLLFSDPQAGQRPLRYYRVLVTP
jgi:subtilisin family serine protease